MSVFLRKHFPICSKMMVGLHAVFAAWLLLASATVSFSQETGLFTTQESQAFAPYDEPVLGEGTTTFNAPPNFGETTDLPKIRSLGKLVSIEGRPGDRGSLREFAPMGESETGAELMFDPDANTDCKLPRLSYFSQEPYMNYRSEESGLNFLPAGADQFGWVSLENAPYLARGYRSGLTTAINMHFLSGPNAVAIPPRLYDFSLGYQKRGRISDVMSYDLATTIGVFSDFEDSAKDGVRYPGHAVGMLHLKPEFDLVFGVDYLSRDDIKLLPVGGFSWRPQSMPDMRFDLVFPRPRIDYAIDNQSKVYLAGRLGGGTWDIEFPNNDNDVMTYRDLQVLCGFERRNSEGHLACVEFGYVFDRKLEFRTLSQPTEFDDAFVLRLVTRK